MADFLKNLLASIGSVSSLLSFQGMFIIGNSEEDGRAAGIMGLDQPQTVYDRVMRTKTLRCGYHTWAPYLVKDANSGAMSGIYFDYVEKLAASLNLKVEWAEEVGYGDLITALNGGRIDDRESMASPGYS